MRNDFYVGMYEDQYLSHTMTPRAHKYIEKVFVNGKWRYIYKKGKVKARRRLDKIGRELDYELSTPAATDALDPEAWLIKTGYQAYKKHKKK